MVRPRAAEYPNVGATPPWNQRIANQYLFANRLLPEALPMLLSAANRASERSDQRGRVESPRRDLAPYLWSDLTTGPNSLVRRWPAGSAAR